MPNRHIPIKILAVDDLEENLVALRAILSDQNFEIISCKSGKDALEALLVHEFALALIDVQMPEMDGFELASLMRGTERTREIPIIFVTAGPRDHERLFQGYDSGAVDFLFKPLEPHILRQKIGIFVELYRGKRRLALTLRLNEELVAIVGHDLKNPLSTIMMTASALAASNSDPGVQKAAGRVVGSGVRMQRIIEQILDLSRARLGGGIPIDPKPTDLAVVVQKIVAESQAADPEAPIVVACDGDAKGEWDGERLGQVVSNLVGNALRHGAGTRPVDIQVRGGGDAVVFSVNNDGAVPTELLPELFEPFRSGARDRARDGGLGLGLYIVQSIVQAHGGTVDVQSTPQAGTTFSVKLPKKSTTSLAR